jgi:hypothetical protein
MGAFYTNLTLRGPNLETVLSYLNAEQTSAYLAEPQPGTVVVYDEVSDESQDDAALMALAERLTRQFDCGALAVLNHDDDILAFWLYEKGAQLDQYDSCPGYFTGEEAPPAGGDAAALCRVFGVDAAKAAELETILRTAPEGYVFASGRHEDIVDVLGLPDCVVSFGFRYLSTGDLPDGLSGDDLKRSGPQS